MITSSHCRINDSRSAACMDRCCAGRPSLHICCGCCCPAPCPSPCWVGWKPLLSAMQFTCRHGGSRPGSRTVRSIMELVLQGVANVASALFGGISVTRLSLAPPPVFAPGCCCSPWRGFCIPPSCWSSSWSRRRLPAMCPWRRWRACWWWCAGTCWRRSRIPGVISAQEMIVLMATFGVTLLKDLTTGIIIGCALAALYAFSARFLAPVRR